LEKHHEEEVHAEAQRRKERGGRFDEEEIKIYLFLLKTQRP